MNRLAVVSLTPGGQALATRLVEALGDGEVVPAAGVVRETLPALFAAGRPLVCIMALGIVVRLLGPWVRSKETDPPVVVVDEAGQFAISVLGGHRGGANALARRVAAALGAVPVLTTASEALGLPAVDLLGQEWGWRREEEGALTALAAAVVRGDPVAVYQDAGRRDWWPDAELPAGLQRVATWPPPGTWAGALVISDRVLPPLAGCPAVTYRPRTLVAGIGCRRGVPCAELEDLFTSVCRDAGLAPRSLALVASAALKADEPGLLEFAARHEVPLRTFNLAELAAVPDVPTPSERVRAKLGVAGVAEPAALLASGSAALVVPKRRAARVTLAIARREET